MVEQGMTRDEAYRIVQTAAHTALDSGESLRDVLSREKTVTLSTDEMNAAFDLARVLQHAGRAVDALHAELQN